MGAPDVLERLQVAEPTLPPTSPPGFSPTAAGNARLGLLPEPEGRFGPFTVAAVVNLALAGLVVLFTMAHIHEQARQRQFEQTELVFPVDVPKPPPPVLPRIKVVAPPPAVQPKIELPRQIDIPKPIPEPPKVQAIRTTPVMPEVPAARPKAVVTPPLPRVGLFASNSPTPVANNRSAPTVKTGGFGDPAGVVVNPNSTRSSNLPTVGSFANAPGAGLGAGAARQGSVHGTGFGSGVVNGVPGGTSRGAVASAGFGSGTVGGSGGAPRGAVAATGFGTPVATAAAPSVQAHSSPVTGVVLTSKPRPAYTAEARDLHIEGQVTLQVRFTATGQVEVLRVISGLGHGLDEEAKRAAMQIKFKPAMKDGQPVDQVSNVNISFQLA